MKPLLASAVLTLLLVLFLSPASRPGLAKAADQGDSRLKGYKTPEGIKLEIVAEAPVIRHPVAMTFASDGTPYVLEWQPDAPANVAEVVETFTYKDGSTRQVATLKKQVKDVVKTLADTTGKGIYDKATVVREDEQPSGILLHEGWLYLSGRGTARRYKSSKTAPGADTPGSPEVIAQGFCGFGRQQVSGMTLGPDGWLYITSGPDNYVEGSDGSRATVLRSGAVFRCRPDGSQLTTFALGFCNPHGNVAFDAASNLFHVDNGCGKGDKFAECRLLYLAEGSDFGWRSRQGSFTEPDPMRSAFSGELPGKMRPQARLGQGTANGLLIYNDSCLPEKYRGLLFYPDAAHNRIRAYRVEREGAGFVRTQEFDFLTSDDPHFHPTQMVVGPDGAMYILDSRTRSDDGLLGSDSKNGRIYRVSWAGSADEPALPRRSMDSEAKILKLPDEELLRVLASVNAGERAVARSELRRRGEKNRPALLKMLDDGDQPDHARFSALGVLQSFWNVDVQKLCEDLLNRGESDLRRQSAEALGWNTPAGNREVMASLLRAMVDQDRAVRRAAALALARVGGAAAADSLANTIAFDEAKDPYLLDGYVRALEIVGKPGIERLIAVADSGVQKDLDRVVDVFTGLRSRAAAEALPGLLQNPHLSNSQRNRLTASWDNYLLDPPLTRMP